MMKKQTLSRYVVTAALISAGYAMLTYLSAVLGLAYGGVQFRLSEALNVLAAFTPAAIPGIIIGCVLGNMASPFGIVDVAVGSMASGLSAVSIWFLAKRFKETMPYIAVIPSVLFNAVMIGLEITLFLKNGSSIVGFLLTALQVAIGELTVCLALGVPFYFVIKKNSNRLF